MGRSDSAGAEKEEKVGIFLRARSVYKRYTRSFIVTLTKAEAELVLDALESWIEGYQYDAWDVEDELVDGMHASMSTAIDVRSKLWRKLR